MIQIESKRPNTLLNSVYVDLPCSNLYTAITAAYHNLPQLLKEYDKSVYEILGFNTNIDSLSAELYMSDVLSKILNNNISDINLDAIPNIVIYSLSEHYNLIPFLNLFTVLNAGTEFVPPSIWADQTTNTININQLANAYGTVNVIYNNGTDTKFQSMYIGDLDGLPDQSVKISINGQSSEGTEAIAFADTLTIPSSFSNRHCKFESKVMWNNLLQSKQMEDTNNFIDGTITTSDGNSIGTKVYNGRFDGKTTLEYTMYKETGLKQFIDKYFSTYDIKTINYNTYPYDKWIYAKPGDSSIVSAGNKTVIENGGDYISTEGDSIHKSMYINCKDWPWESTKVQDGKTGRKFRYVEIGGWYWLGKSEKYENTDKETVSNSEFKITYQYNESGVKYRKGSILNEKVYASDRECYIGKWNGSDESVPYAQNRYSYGKVINLESNPRTACSFKLLTKTITISNGSRNALKQYAKVLMYHYINDCIRLFTANPTKAAIANALVNYLAECKNKDLSGTLIESPLISCILVRYGKTTITTIDEIVNEFGSEYKLDYSQSEVNTDKLAIVHVPKIDIYGTSVKLSTSTNTDFNRYIIYGNTDKYSVQNIPIKISSSIQIDNQFIVHNEVFSGQCPNKLLNFNPYG